MQQTSAAPARRKRNPPYGLFLAALLLAGSAWIALRQPPRPGAAGALPFLSWDWWAHPLEFNAEARLPYITGAIASMAYDGSGLWIGGQGGLLLQSQDGGGTWERPSIPDSLRRVHLPVSGRAWNRPWSNKGSAKK